MKTWGVDLKKLMLCMAISAMATTVHADKENRSLFQCGVNLGGAKKVYKPTATKKEYRFKDTYQVAPTRYAGTLHLATPESTPVKDKSALRLPRTVTVARFGCSWR
jgi:hypothetical protein